jgi:hypothetical protein
LAKRKYVECKIISVSALENWGGRKNWGNKSEKKTKQKEKERNFKKVN